MAHRKQAWSKRVHKERFKKKYLTRMQATRLLQLDNIHFRRLCILKGIYPRALARSKQKQSGNEKQYYLAREIKWLVRDQLAEKMMAFRAWEKKLKRATAMNDKNEVRTLQSAQVKPKHSLIATIKERYPYFSDALKDVDDAMSMIALYAFLAPEINAKSTIETHHALTSGLHERAQQMCDSWNDYIARAHVLNKGFISIKGYYYEAIIRNERIRWLCPHEYAHRFPPGIQQYIMLSFLEFYLELMKFVLFKLNADLVKEEAEQAKIEEEEQDGVNVNAEDFEPNVSSAGNNNNSGNNLKTQTESINNDNNNNVVIMVDENQTLQKKQQELLSKKEMMQRELQKVRNLFANLTFYISREVPLKHAKLVIESCNGRVLSEYKPLYLTHVVMDRPTLPPGMKRDDKIEYIQPQYLFDCLNARVLLPVHGYRLGETLPPHISPFTVAISNSVEDQQAVQEALRAHPRIVPYTPERVHEIRRVHDPTYVAADPTGKVRTAMELIENEMGEDANEDGAAQHVHMEEILDAEDDVALSDDELREVRTSKPSWENEEVSEEVTRPLISAFKVRKQRQLNLMNAPTSEVVAAKRRALAQEAAKRQANVPHDVKIKRKLTEMAKDEAATRKMQLQVARKKAARYYKMINGLVTGANKKSSLLQAKADQLKQGKLHPAEDGSGLINTRKEVKAQRRAMKQSTLQSKEKSMQTKKTKLITSKKNSSNNKGKKKNNAANPYRKLPKWVQ